MRSSAWAVLLAATQLATPLTAQNAPPPLHLTRRGDTVLVHLRASWEGATAAVLERLGPDGTWVAVGDTAGPPADAAALKAALGPAYESLAAEVRSALPELLYARLRAEPSLAGFHAMLDPTVGRSLGRRFVDPAAPSGSVRYRVRRLGATAPPVLEGTAPTASEVLPAPVIDSVTHTATALTVTFAYPRDAAGAAALGFHIVGRNSADTVARRLTPRLLGRTPGRGDESAEVPLVRQGDLWQLTVIAVGVGGLTRASTPVEYLAEDRTPPRPVLAPIVRMDSTGTALLDWPAAMELDAAGYHVYRSRDGKQIGDRVTTHPLPVEVLAWRDTTERAPGDWIYRVSVVDSAGNESEPGNVAVVRVLDVTPPETPERFAFEVVGDSLVRLRWARVAARDLREYVVARRREDGFGGAAWARLNPPMARDTTWRDRGDAGGGFRPGTRLRYRIIAVDSTGNESVPAEALVVVPDRRPPAPPPWVRGRATESGVTVTWAPSPAEDVASYEVYRRRVGADTLLGVWPSDMPRRVDDLLPDARVTVAYAVVALDSAGNRSARTLSEPVAAGDAALLNPPVNVRAVVERSGVTIAWDAVTGAARYRVERATARNGDYSVVGEATASRTRAVDPAGRVGMWYRAIAIDADGRASTPSIPVQAVAAEGRP
jgi:hypothetical protein